VLTVGGVQTAVHGQTGVASIFLTGGKTGEFVGLSTRTFQSPVLASVPLTAFRAVASTLRITAAVFLVEAFAHSAARIRGKTGDGFVGAFRTRMQRRFQKFELALVSATKGAQSQMNAQTNPLPQG